jgi:hypothetical protein
VITLSAVAQQRRIETYVPAKYDWHEHVYPNERFAITFPYEPGMQADPKNQGLTQYSVGLPQDTALTLQTMPAPNCAANLKDSVEEQAVRFAMPKPKEIRMGDGIIAFEVESKQGNEWRYYRFWCGDKIVFYALARGPEAKRRPAELARILNSFRIVAGAK